MKELLAVCLLLLVIVIIYTASIPNLMESKEQTKQHIEQYIRGIDA